MAARILAGRPERRLLQRLAGRARRVECRQADGGPPESIALFTEGEMPRAVFILCGGRAKVTSSSAEGKTLIMRIAVRRR